MKFSFALLAALAAPMLAAAAGTQPARLPRDDGVVPSLNPTGIELADLASDPDAVSPAKVLTNAQRMRRNLALNPPVSRTEEKRHQPSSVPLKSRSGHIQVTGEDGNILGFIGTTLNKFGEYGLVDKKDDGVHCTVNGNDDDDTSDLTISNSMFPSLPYMGAFQGSATGKGSSGFCFLSATSQVSKGVINAIVDMAFTKATSIKTTVQTAIWKFNFSSNTLKSTWLNEQGKPVDNMFVYLPSEGAIALVQDYDAFSKAWPVEMHKCILSVV